MVDKDFFKTPHREKPISSPPSDQFDLITFDGAFSSFSRNIFMQAARTFPFPYNEGYKICRFRFSGIQKLDQGQFKLSERVTDFSVQFLNACLDKCQLSNFKTLFINKNSSL